MFIKRIFLIAIILITSQIIFGQKSDLPKLPHSGDKISDFVPKAWKIAHQTEGDLDSDGYAETILVLQGTNQELVKKGDVFDWNVSLKDEKTGDLVWVADNNPVILAIVTKDQENYRLIAQNNQLIPLFYDDLYRWRYSVSLENQTLTIGLDGNISHGVRDVFGGETKSFRFQMQDARLVLVEAKTKKWSNAVFSTYGGGNGRFDLFESYDFRKTKGCLIHTVKENEGAVVEEIFKITDPILFEVVSNSFAELKTVAKTETQNGIQTNNLTKIPYGIKKATFDYQTNRNKVESELVKKEIFNRVKEIYKLGEANGFKCDENDFRIVDWVSGKFVKSNSSQNAYLYHLCSSGKAQYATGLGGIVIAEKRKIKAHYVFSNVSGYEQINVLPDINKNGLSEIVLEFAHSINSLNFARAIGIFEVRANGKFTNLGETDVFRRLENQTDDDISYTIFVKSGKTPEYFRETFGSGNQKNEWFQTEKLTKFTIDKRKENIFKVLLPKQGS